MKILIVGGDKRYLQIIDYYKKYDVDVIGFDKINNKSLSIEDVESSDYDVIIFPVNGIMDDYSVNTPFNNSIVKIDLNFLENMKESAIVFSGTECKILNELKRDYVRIMEDKEVSKNNGCLTVEGILSDIIINNNFSIKDSNIVVFGYGNIGKPLVSILRKLGAFVKVGVCENDDFLSLDNSFFTSCCYEHHLKDANIIINTVPKLLLDSKKLNHINSDCYILDVSSFPYGVDFDNALNLNLKVKKLGGIPGLISPKSASLLILNKINSVIKDV